MSSISISRAAQPSIGALNASIELMPKTVLRTNDLIELLPTGTKIYLPDLDGDRAGDQLRAAKRLHELGFNPVPHLAARRIHGPAMAHKRALSLRNEANVTEVMVIAGDVDGFDVGIASALKLLETGALDTAGVHRIGVAGHPEGNPVVTDKVATQALKAKQAFANRSDARMHIVSQFSFNPQAVIRWSEDLQLHGINLPIHIGIAGPARVSTLLKYAATCGVGASASFFSKHSRKLVGLAHGYSPDSIADSVSDHLGRCDKCAIERIHVYAFGGLKASSEWLIKRGHWT